MNSYNVHIGDSERKFVRLVEVQAKNFIEAANLSGLQAGEHLLRVATPAFDRKRARKLNCKIEEIYELNPGREIKRAEGHKSQSLTDGFYNILP